MPTFLSNASFALVDATAGFRHGTAATPLWKTGTGTPEGVVAAPVGSLYSRLDGSTDTSVYRKETGADANGWVAVTNSGAGGGAVASVDGRTGVVTLDDKYVDVTGDMMTGNLGFGVASPTAKLQFAPAVDSVGGILFGDDTTLYRDATNSLRTDDLLRVVGIRSSSPQTGATLGPNLAANGSFDADLSGWTVGSNWTWNAGAAQHTPGTTAALSQTITGLTAGTQYQISLTITNRTAGSVTIALGTSSSTQNSTAQFLAVPTSATANLTITPTSNFDGFIADIALQLINSSTPQAFFDGTPGVSAAELRAGGTNLAVGMNALSLSLAASTSCTAVGQFAGQEDTTGANNTAFGYAALKLNRTGSANTAVGANAFTAATAGDYNTAVGYQSLLRSTTSSYNVAVGSRTLQALTTGQENTAIGSLALYNAVTSLNNVAVGSSALFSATGSFNVALGYACLYSQTVASSNVAIGTEAGFKPNNQSTNATTTGARQTLLGYQTGQGSAALANDITCVGASATASGHYGTAVGSGTSAGATGSVAIGKDSAGTSATTLTANDFVLGTTNHNVKVPGTLAVTSTIDGSAGFRHGSAITPSWTTGVGAPEGVVTAPIGSIYSRTDGSTSTALYRKETGVGNTGWVATSSSAGGVTSVDGRTGAVVLSDLYVDVAGDTMTGQLNAPTIALGTGPSATGTIRLAAAGQIQWRKTDNTGDASYITQDPSDSVVYSSPAWHRFYCAGAIALDLRSPGFVVFPDVAGDKVQWYNGYKTGVAANTLFHDVPAGINFHEFRVGGASKAQIKTASLTLASGVVVESPSGYRFGSTLTPSWTTGSGTPEGVVTAPIGSLYSRIDGGTGTAIYRKETGGGATGWAATSTTSGSLAVQDWASLPVTAHATPLATDSVAIGVSPFAKSWHDVIRFNSAGVPTEETLSGTTWTTRALTTSIFDGTEPASVPTLIDGTTNTAIRWTWGPGMLQFSYVEWLRLAIGYTQPTPSLAVDVEGSNDGVAWTYYINNATQTSSITKNIWIRAGGASNMAYTRVTLRAVNASAIVMNALQFYSQRPGDQGKGVSSEFPYAWNFAKQIAVGGGTPGNGPLTIGTNSTATSGGMWFGNDIPLFRSAAARLRTTAGFIADGGFWQASTGPSWTSGAGSPEGVVTAPIGSMYSRTDGAADTAVYRKETGTGNTGWVAIADVFVNINAPAGTPNSGDLWYDTDEPSSLVMPLSVANGGTGGTSPTMARSSLSVPYGGNSVTTAGGPTTGTYVRGDTWLDNSNVWWVCTVAGSPGTWLSTNLGPAGPLSIANGGTGATTAAAARTSLAMPGEELAYNQTTGNVSVTATSSATAQTVVSGTSRSYDGSSILLLFNAASFSVPAGAFVVFNLMDGATEIMWLGSTQAPASGVVYSMANLSRKLTPTAGTHVYAVAAWISGTGTATFQNGTGNPGSYMPAFLRVTRV